MPVLGLALLVRFHLLECAGIGGFVILDRDEGAHTAHGVRAAAVTDLDHAQGVGAHEGRGHRDHGAVGQHFVGARLEPLDIAEDVVPAAAVQADNPVAQNIQDFVQFKRGGDGFDQDRDAHRAGFKAQRLLRVPDDQRPEPGLLHALQLGQIVVRARAIRLEGLMVVEQIKTEIEQAA